MNEVPPGIDLAAHRALGVLDGNLALRLGDRDHAGDHTRQQQHQSDGMAEIELGFHAAAREEHVFQSHCPPAAAAPECRW